MPRRFRGFFAFGGTMVFRADQATLEGRASITPEGYIRGNAVVTRTGVFLYAGPEGTVVRELRHPDDVFEAASLDTLKMIPVTNEHPEARFVDSSNAKELSIGQTGEAVSVDGTRVLSSLTITDGQGVASYESGRQELSLGYSCDIAEESGVYNGQPYDTRQRNIRYNHLAIVDQARAGAIARINLDSADAVFAGDVEAVSTQANAGEPREGRKMKVRIKGDEYEVAPEVAEEREEMRDEVTELKKQLEDACAERDKAMAMLDEMTEKMKEMEGERSDAAIAAKVKARMELERKATKIVGDDVGELTDRQLIEKVILSKHDGLDLASKSDDYVRARFDAIVEVAESKVAKQIQVTASKVDGDRVDGEKAKSEAIGALMNAWKQPRNGTRRAGMGA